MKIFLTGGAGFIGANLAKFHLDKGDEVLVFDNLSRSGTELNERWLKKISVGKKYKFIKGDVRDIKLLAKNIKGSDVIYHMAAQVAVTASLIDPINDFEINALGTLNTLDAYRRFSPEAKFIYASTNKVFGGLNEVNVTEKINKYIFASKKYKNGISEERILDFHSPYGCSKGAGDQYVRDYGRVYNLKTIVFRQSCVYGKRQFGNEDQGWVMHFVRSVLSGNKLTIYGNGKQVRDLLDVSDLISAYQMALKKVKNGQGEVYNIGGGLKNSISLLELIKLLEMKMKTKVDYKFADWREGDQKIYISDNTKLKNELGWVPKTDISSGLDGLIEWAREIVK
jgi:CDP-paratose 2-epimerase